MQELEAECEDSAFEFEEWDEKAGLNRNSLKFLMSEELVQIRTLELIEDIYFVTMPLPTGQCKLLKVLELTIQPLATQI